MKHSVLYTLTKSLQFNYETINKQLGKKFLLGLIYNYSN